MSMRGDQQANPDGAPSVTSTVTPLFSTVGLNRLKSAFTPACPRRRTGTFAWRCQDCPTPSCRS
jgi:hypothetical protein